MQESRAQGEEAAAAVCKCRRWEANPCFGCLLSMSLCLFHMLPGVLSMCLQECSCRADLARSSPRSSERKAQGTDAGPRLAAVCVAWGGPACPHPAAEGSGTGNQMRSLVFGDLLLTLELNKELFPSGLQLAFPISTLMDVSGSPCTNPRDACSCPETRFISYQAPSHGTHTRKVLQEGSFCFRMWPSAVGLPQSSVHNHPTARWARRCAQPLELAASRSQARSRAGCFWRC